MGVYTDLAAILWLIDGGSSMAMGRLCGIGESRVVVVVGEWQF